jgi:uncharacterized membrane protein YkgB
MSQLDELSRRCEPMNYLIKLCDRLGILRSEIDYHVLRASMVLIFVFFGYQKWFEYEAQALIPYISNGPLIFWMYPVFGIRGATWFLGVSEWLFGELLFWGFWNKKAGVLGALGGIASFVSTTTIIPFYPDGWAASAGGFPAMKENVSFYLLKQDLLRLSLAPYRETVSSATATSEIPSGTQRKIA